MQHTKNPECREKEEERRELRELVYLSPADEAFIYRGKVAVTQPLKWRELRQKIWALRARMMQKIWQHSRRGGKSGSL